ncbi:hypothetical protein E0Z10_g7841 [Xylaria hypoxylon]|uniref:Transcription factor domain-containing protein n=1 Tax=Xylaria hypoxylon TaxID=37992 RepID=A0A4Z0YPM2_9PEZI|nr:hypothetical protein E0Z10_g7841 [Xylaria hypoxylon]
MYGHITKLLHNFKTGVLDGGIYDVATAEAYMGMTIREAVQAPYLMDQILALSAANMSVKRPHQRQFYQAEAAHLQTRGLVLFNAAQALEATDNALAGFVFSILLSQQVLFDALLIRTDFPVLLEKLIAAFRICGGVRIMGGKSWPFIMAQYQQQAGINLPDVFLPNPGVETVFTMKLAQLGTFLANASLDPSTLSICNAALTCLRHLSFTSKSYEYSAFQTTRLLHWAVAVRPEFIKLLEERRPEALIIVAYYALLIHDTRDYWLSGDAGAFIIRSITKFLGNYWAEWLAWPNEVLDSANSSDRASSLAPINIRMRCRVDELP